MDADVPFSQQEYELRREHTKRLMRERGIDVLYVTSPANLYYLANHELIWYDGRTPTGLVLSQEGPAVLLDGTDHQAQGAATTTLIDEAIYFEIGSPLRDGGQGPSSFAMPEVDTVATALKKLGVRGRRVGLEYWSRAPSGPTLAALASRLREEGADVVDGSFLVDRVRFVKSPQEVDYVRRAAEIADTAMDGVRSSIDVGVTELEVAAEIYRLLLEQGGEEPAIRVLVHSGPRSSHYHGPSTTRRIGPEEMVWVDFCGVYKRYHADLSRTFSVGDFPRAREVLAQAAPSVTRLLEAVTVGMPLSEAQRIADEYIDQQGLRTDVWWIGGYSLGADLPPDWVGHIYLGGETFEEAMFEPGVLTNYENLFDFPEEGWGGGFIDTILMTDTGLEVLSKLPREHSVI
ncbi:MAG: Xaa-Pro peptidase family protein [Actinomycetota bacterium]